MYLALCTCAFVISSSELWQDSQRSAFTVSLLLCDSQLAITLLNKRKKKNNPVLIFLIHTKKVTCQVYDPMSLHRLSSLSSSFLLPSRPAHCSRHPDFLRATIANSKKNIYYGQLSNMYSGRENREMISPVSFSSFKIY